MFNQPDDDRHHALVELIQARCRTAGYTAPANWVQWLLNLQLVKYATDHRMTTAQAAHLIPVDTIIDLADALIRTTRNLED